MTQVLHTGTILDRIVAKKRLEVEAIKAAGPADPPAPRPEAGRFVRALLDQRPGRAIIAEVKHASPSAGVIRENLDPPAIARAYRDNGARCLSVLTDEEFFQGSLDVLRQVRAEVDLPLLRKDFIIDPVQIDDATRAGADAILLIAMILDRELLQDLWDHARALNLDVLFEVHEREEIERVAALRPAPALVGVNNRDLRDFSVSVEQTLSLLPHLPPGAAVVSESGLKDVATLERLREAGVAAFLIGTAFMKSPDEGAALNALVYG